MSDIWKHEEAAIKQRGKERGNLTCRTHKKGASKVRVKSASSMWHLLTLHHSHNMSILDGCQELRQEH